MRFARLGRLLAVVPSRTGWRAEIGLDLGSYLVATEGSKTPAWEDALRVGGAYYLRPSRTIPVVFGAGADYRPRFEHRSELRGYVQMSIELPFFSLN